jgi:hypothetical protein
MKIDITKIIAVNKTIEIDYPYYYKDDRMLDHARNVVFGKIVDDIVYEIEYYESYRGGGISYSLTKDDRNDRYFDEEYRSTEQEYNDAKDRALKFLQGH